MHPAPARIAAIIPCYNQAKFLSEAIESVLAQTRAVDEIIVVDDGSPDDAADVARRYPVRLVRQPNRGLPAARNAGVRATAAELIFFLDSDDRALPHAVATLEREHGVHPECALIAGTIQEIDGDGHCIARATPRAFRYDDLYAELLFNHARIFPSACLYRRDAFNAVGGYDERFRTYEDWELDLRLAQRYPVRLIDAVVTEYRLHGTNLSSRSADKLATLVPLLQRYRRRFAGTVRAEAAGAGIQHVRDLCRERTITMLYERLAARSWREAARLAWTLARYDGPAMRARITRKVRRRLAPPARRPV